jgi:outer membrane receptor for Fe3+-dicitrate
MNHYRLVSFYTTWTELRQPSNVWWILKPSSFLAGNYHRNFSLIETHVKGTAGFNYIEPETVSVVETTNFIHMN